MKTLIKHEYIIAATRVSNATVSVANVENAHHSTRSVTFYQLFLYLKGTVSIISSDPLCKDGNAQSFV